MRAWTLLLLAAAATLLGRAPASSASATPDVSCFECSWLDTLPIDDWTAQPNKSIRSEAGGWHSGR